MSNRITLHFRIDEYTGYAVDFDVAACGILQRQDKRPHNIIHSRFLTTCKNCLRVINKK